MKTKVTMTERIASIVIGTAMFIVGLILIALGLTLLPLIGLLVAFPVMSLAFYFFRPGKWAVTAEGKMEPVVAETWAGEGMAA